MALADVTNQRERDKFEENSEGKTAVRSIIDPDQITTLSDNQDDLLEELQKKVNSDEVQPVSNDVLTNAVDGTTTSFRTVDYAHHEIHSGSHYYIEGQQYE